ncbi:MAG: M48 family metalloprotease [Candidatus Omnitrophica bacterium]|nr:M48 family metalloprotease [Candidatus Omnitrophota bacterium]
MHDLSKRYWRVKYTLSVIEIIYILVLLFVFLNTGSSRYLSCYILNLIKIKPIVIAAYLFLLYFVYFLLIFPLYFYRSFILEHKYSLSNQKLLHWFEDSLKAGVIFYILSLILIELFYFSLSYSQKNWWLFISFFWIFLNIVLARILPIYIIPLFFKYKKFTDENLRKYVFEIAKKMGIQILDIFEIDLSKKTLKANAAFLGLGKTRRVILADTLKDKYTKEEIGVVLAHEFAHYRSAHILKLLMMEAISIIFNFYFIFKTSNLFLKRYGFLSLNELGSMPIIFIYLILWEIVITPFKNFISRIFERNADILAIRTTGLKDTFICLMDKLARQNLSDRRPHPIIKIFFFDHPPIEERIDLAKNLKY